MPNIYYWEKLGFSKLVGKVNFSERTFECTSFKEEKDTRYIRGNVYFGIIVFSCLSSTETCLRFSLTCLAREKSLLSKFLRKWSSFQGHNESFPKYLGWKLKFKKTEARFFRRNSTDNNGINIFLSLENPCTFLLAKEKTWKRIFNTNSELSQNRTENKLCHPKQQ